MLDLTFLATGRRQHVFVPTGAEPGAWVYKIPAAFGYLLPYRHDVRTTGRVTSWKRALHHAFLVLPGALDLAVVGPAAGWIDRHVPGGRVMLAAPRAVARLAQAGRDRILMRQQRRARARDFAAMLDRLDELSAAGLGDLVLPFRSSRETEAILRVNGVAIRYRGPVLQQRRVDGMFSAAQLHSFDWRELVRAQSRMWRKGFALAEKGEVLGYRSWALLDGRLHLADTSSLTRSPTLARRALDDRELNGQVARVMARQASPAAAEAFEEFFALVRTEINDAKLVESWRADLPAPSARELTHRSFGGLLWTIAGRGGVSLLNVPVLMILARRLTPADFGTVAAALIVISLSKTFSHIGLGPAIVQRKELERRHLQAAFTGSLFLGIVIGAMVWLLAPLAAAYFRNPGVQPVLRALAVVFPLGGAAVVAESLMRRDLRFRWLAKLDTITFALGQGVVGITLAMAGFGVWALVGAAIAVTLTRSIALVIARRAPFVLLPEWRALRELLYFSGGFTLAKLANFAALQGDNLVVGRWLGPAALGIYGRAYGLMSLPATLIGSALDDVLFPSMARVQDDAARLGLMFRRGVSVVALLAIPTSAVLVVLAPELILVVLGPQWTAAVVPFQVLAAGTLLRMSYKISDSLARSTGAVYRRAWRQGVYAVLVLAGALAGQRWGITGVAAGVVVALAANFLLMAQLSLDMSRMSWRTFAAAHGPGILLGLATGAVAWGGAAALRALSVSPLLLMTAVGAGAAVAALLLIRTLPGWFLGRDGRWAIELVGSFVARGRPGAARGPRGGQGLAPAGHHAAAD